MHQFSQRDFDQATLILRVSLGIYFVVAGLAQLVNYIGLVDSVSGFGIVTSSFGGGIVATMFPWLELILGLLLILGLTTSIAAALIALASFLLAVVNGFTSGASLSKEILFIAVALALMLMGGGAYSLDGKVRGVGKKVGVHPK